MGGMVLEQQELDIAVPAVGWRCPLCTEWLPDWPYASGRFDHCDPRPSMLSGAFRDIAQARGWLDDL